MRGARAKKLRKELIAAFGERGAWYYKRAKKMWARGDGVKLRMAILRQMEAGR